MRIFLVDPPASQGGWNTGLAWLSGALGAAGIEHAALDMVNFKISDDEMLDEIRKFAPDVVGFSIKTATYNSSVRLAKLVKARLPGMKVVAGGPHVTLYHEELLKENDCFDAAFVGDSEESLVEWMNNGGSASTPGVATLAGGAVSCESRKSPGELDALPFPDFSRHIKFDRTIRPYPLVTSRGCPYGCVFCSVGRISGRKWRHRSPESVVGELKAAKTKWGFTEFDVLDDTFTQEVDRARAICRLLVEKKVRMRWSCPNGIRADKVTPELMADMFEAGCHTVIFGVESADPEQFRFINKSEELSDVVNAIGVAKKAGMRVGGYFIIGLPGDSFDKNIRSLEFASEIGLDWAHFNILAPYPGTRVWSEIEKSGRFLEDYRNAQHFSAIARPVFELNDFSADDITRTYRTVHVRQRLYHLVLPAGLDEKQTKRAIRRLRMEYDREAWIADIRKDAKRIVNHWLVPVRAIGWDIKRRRSRGAPPATRRPSVARAASDGLRILFVGDYIGRAGGTERYIYDLVESLGAMGHKTAWAYENDIGSEGVDIPKFQMKGLAAPAPDSEVDAALDRIVAEFSPDVIHIHNVHAPRIVEACLERRPTLRTVHDHNIVCPSMNKMWATGGVCDSPAGFACVERLLDGGCYVLGKQVSILFERLAVTLAGIEANRRLPKIFTTTQFMRRELAMNGFDESRVSVLPLFLDFDTKPEPPDESLPLRILWAGRIVMPDKGPDYFIDSLRYIKAPFKATVAGFGPNLDFVKSKVKELGLDDKVEFIGKVSRAEMDELYSRSHVVAFTPMWAEPFGYVGIEAASRGRAVVAFDTGGVSDWLENGKGGFLVSRGNTRALALRFDRLALDVKARREMGEAHREAAMKRHDKTKHLETLVAAYREISGIGR